MIRSLILDLSTLHPDILDLMIRFALRATRVVLDGRNRFPVRLVPTRTRRRNDRKRLAIIQENASIIREGRKALMRRIARETSEGSSPPAPLHASGSPPDPPLPSPVDSSSGPQNHATLKSTRTASNT